MVYIINLRLYYNIYIIYVIYPSFIIYYLIIASQPGKNARTDNLTEFQVRIFRKDDIDSYLKK